MKGFDPSSGLNFSEPFIRRPIGTSLLMVGLLLLGIVGYRMLPVAPLPSVEFPVISVSASLPGASPEVMAASVATPLERRLGQIAGVNEITSSSNQGSSSVTVQFDLGRSIEAAAKDVQAAISAAGNELPKDLPSAPRLRKVNPAGAPIMILALTSDTLRPGDVYNAADAVLGQKLSQIKGVSQVQINGGEKTAVRVRVNPTLLASMGLGLDDIRTVLSNANANSPKGSFDGEVQSHTITADDQLFGADAYRRLVIPTKSGASVRLGDVGTVIDSVENNRLAGWAGAERAVLVIIQKQASANIVETIDAVNEALPQIQLWLPAGIKMQVLNDRSRTIRASIHDVQFTLILTVALVIMIMWVFLRDVWATAIPSVAIPLAIAGTFAIMAVAGFSMNNLSLMALTIAVGFVVDDAIVVVENVVRHLEEGDSPLEAALKGARQVGFTVISMSLSLIAVFIPILFMGGLLGRMFREFAGTLSAAIAVSAVISLTLSPMMCATLLRSRHLARKPTLVERWIEKGLDWMLAEYTRGLDWVLVHSRLMLAVTGLAIVGTVWLYVVVPKGFFPQQDTGLIMGFTEAAQDISFQAMSERQQAVMRVILQDPDVVTLGSFMGGGGGGGSVNRGFMFITLKPQAERPDVLTIINRIRQQTQDFVGISLFMAPAQDLNFGGRQARGGIQFALSDGEIDRLNQWAPLVIERLRTVPELVDVSSDRAVAGLQTNVVIDRTAASRMGVQPQAIDDALYNAFGQRQVSTMYTNINQFHVVLEADPSVQRDPSMLSHIYVKGSGGVLVPLSTIARFEYSTAPLVISHQGEFPTVTLSFSQAPGVPLDEAMQAVRDSIAGLGLPAGMIANFAGNASLAQSGLSSQPLLLAAAILTIYILLGVLYESLIHPITILSTIPSAGVGALVALLLFGQELTIVAIIGIVLLIGIVKKNAIMMVDFALEAERKNGLSPAEAIYQACRVRFRPIMMTTMAAILGALPLAFGTGAGSEIRRPLGIAVIGGLLLSQMLTLYTTPVIYLTFERMAERRRQRKARRLGHAQPAE